MAQTNQPIVGSIQLRGVRCPRAAPGETALLLADVSVQVDLRAVAEHDALDAALDFAALAAAIKEVVASAPGELLEALAVSAADDILRRFRSAEVVWLRLAKPNPAGLDAAEEAVELRAARAG